MFRRGRKEPDRSFGKTGDLRDLTETEAQAVEKMAKFATAAKYLYFAFGVEFSYDDLSERSNRLLVNPTPKDAVDRGILALDVAMGLIPSAVIRKEMGEID